MNNNDDTKDLSAAFALIHETAIKQPLMLWNRANARQEAGMEAYMQITGNKAQLKQMGIEKPAAALFVNDQSHYAYSIYEQDKQQPEDVVPENKRVILTIDPY